jgi:hypothetical protein
MKPSLRSVWIIVLLFLAALTAQAQSSNELRAKYGSAMEAYEIRPFILMTVKYTEDALVNEYVIEAHHTSKGSVDGNSFISRDTAREIIDEVVPMSQRGRYIGTMSFTGGCNELTNEDYERVEIKTFHTCSPIKGANVASIIVHWKNRVNEKG